MVIGSAGLGKTGSLIFPLLSTLHDRSAMVVDTKSVLYGMFKDDLEKRGYRVELVDFVGDSQGSGYDPVQYIEHHKDTLNGSEVFNELDVTRLASVLLPMNVCREDPYWSIEGANILSTVIAYCLENSPERKWNMRGVVEAFKKIRSSLKVMNTGVKTLTVRQAGISAAKYYSRLDREISRASQPEVPHWVRKRYEDLGLSPMTPSKHQQQLRFIDTSEEYADCRVMVPPTPSEWASTSGTFGW